MERLEKDKALIALLQKSFLFQGLPARLAEETLWAEGCEYFAFSTGEALYEPNRYRPAVALLAAGRAVAYKPRGAEPTVLNTFGPGAVFGVAAVFTPVDRYVACVEAKRPCKALFLTQPLLEALFEKDVRAAKNYIAYLSGRIRYLNRRIDGFTAGSAVEKLALYLWELYCNNGGPTFLLPSGMSQLAAVLDLGRASLYRAFDQLEARAAAARKGREVTILSPAGVRALLPPISLQ